VIIVLFIYIFVGLGFELKTSLLQSIGHTTWAILPVHFNLVILEIGFRELFPGLASNQDPPNVIFPSSWDYRNETLASC
jgi:hypothetical protein